MSAIGIKLTDTERDFLRIASRLGHCLVGARPRFRGHSLLFVSGVVGDLEEWTCARKELPHVVMRLLASRKRGNA